MRIGLIAGSGQFPLIFAREAAARGFEVFAVAYFNETDPELEKHVKALKWLHLGQIKRLLNFFKAHEIGQAVMMGAIRNTRLFTDVKPDTKIISLIARMKHTHDDGLLRAFADLLEREGIQVQSSTFLLPGLLAEKGCWTRRRPTRAEKADIDLGWRLAKEIGRLDIGQCIVVKEQMVLAVEAVEGTDEAIRRGGRLGKGDVTVIKVCKPNQDRRLDLPVIGSTTVQTLEEAGATALVVEAGKTIVADKGEAVRLADEKGICLIGM